MFSLSELNEAMGMDRFRNGVVDWSPAHIHGFEMNQFDLDIFRHNPDQMDNLHVYAKNGLAYSGLCDGQVICMFGMFPYWPGVWEAWMIPSKNLSRKSWVFHRGALRFFEFAAERASVRRLQFCVHSANVRADKWAKACYFTREGLLRRYGPDGADYTMYSRIFE